MDCCFRAAVEQAQKCGELHFAGSLSKELIATSLRESGAWFQGPNQTINPFVPMLPDTQTVLTESNLSAEIEEPKNL